MDSARRTGGRYAGGRRAHLDVQMCTKACHQRPPRTVSVPLRGDADGPRGTLMAGLRAHLD
eukprot:5588275-Lingulodinium_polyedra.AAC.1